MIEKGNYRLTQSLTKTMDLHDACIVIKQSFRCRLSMFLNNGILFVDEQCYNTRIESGNRNLKQSLTDTMDLYNEKL